MKAQGIESSKKGITTDLLKNRIADKRNYKREIEVQIENLFRKDSKKFLAYTRQRVRNQEDAEDILHDVFANVLAASKRVQKPIENIASWVFTALRNKIIDYYRKKRVETFSDIHLPNSDEDGYDPIENLLTENTSTPEVDLYRKTIWENLQEGLAELPEEQKDIFVKNEFEGISFREISEETGVNINTLLARKRYAVLYLRKKLAPLYNTVND